MKIFFLRHGLAADREDWKGDDSDRPLTEQGRARMKQEAEAFAKLELEPDVVVTSPLVRAVQTAEIVADHLKRGAKLVKDERLGPDFGPKALAEILSSYPKADALLLVGHEPGMSDAISYLIGGGRVVCKKGGLACVEVSDPASMAGELVWLIPPKVLTL